jgi:protein-S-isoprenylcysteine O-methyltransferase Ste14
MRSYIVLGWVLGYFTLVLGVRMAVHHKKTGTTGFVARTKSATEILAGTLLLLGGALAIAAPFAKMPLLITTSLATDLASAALLVASTVGTWWSQSAMGRSWRIGVDDRARTELVTGGPFRFVRNPIFSFMILASFAFFLQLPNLAMALGAAALFLGVELQVRFVEEPYLEKTHGDAYRAYLARTGRFLPTARAQRS